MCSKEMCIILDKGQTDDIRSLPGLYLVYVWLIDDWQINTVDKT